MIAIAKSLLYVGVIITRGLQKQKNALNCYFCVREGSRKMKFGMVVTYEIQMISKNIPKKIKTKMGEENRRKVILKTF